MQSRFDLPIAEKSQLFASPKTRNRKNYKYEINNSPKIKIETKCIYFLNQKIKSNLCV